MNIRKRNGRKVILCCEYRGNIYKGSIEGWDSHNRSILHGAKAEVIPLDHILNDKAEGAGASKAKGAPHSVGYVMHDRIQFDTAVFFKSPVMVWQKDRLIYLHTTLSKHNDREVILATGETLIKEDYVFVVRSIRGGVNNKR